MAVTLTKYPVESSSGKVRNIFAGFSSVELEFKREDAQIVDISQGVDDNILISITGDITSELIVGEYVYFYSTGSSYTYDGRYKVLDISFLSPNTEITVEGDFIEVSTGGYCNYKQNWFLESKLIDIDNSKILVYPQLLESDGSPSGEVSVNVSMLVDFLVNEIKTTSQEVSNAANNCKVMYREVWRENDSEAFTLASDDQIIIIYAAEETEIQAFINKLDVPRMWDGYPFALNLLSSLENLGGKRISVSFDELDINMENITEGNLIHDFSPSEFGILQANFGDKTAVLNDNTRYIVFNANTSGSADYLTGDYDDNDYLTINTA